jgi:hypothetical protein
MEVHLEWIVSYYDIIKNNGLSELTTNIMKKIMDNDRSNEVRHAPLCPSIFTNSSEGSDRVEIKSDANISIYVFFQLLFPEYNKNNRIRQQILHHRMRERVAKDLPLLLRLSWFPNTVQSHEIEDIRAALDQVWENDDKKKIFRLLNSLQEVVTIRLYHLHLSNATMICEDIDFSRILEDFEQYNSSEDDGIVIETTETDHIIREDKIEVDGKDNMMTSPQFLKSESTYTDTSSLTEPELMTYEERVRLVRREMQRIGSELSAMEERCLVIEGRVSDAYRTWRTTYEEIRSSKALEDLTGDVLHHGKKSRRGGDRAGYIAIWRSYLDSKTYWCLPGKVVGLYQDGIGPIDKCLLKGDHKTCALMGVYVCSSKPDTVEELPSGLSANDCALVAMVSHTAYILYIYISIYRNSA